MTAGETPKAVATTPTRRPDDEIGALLGGPIMISVGVPQGLNISRDDPASLRSCLVRSGEQFAELTPEAFTLWTVLAIPRTPAEFAAAAADQLPPAAVDEGLALLKRERLVATFERGPTWLHWSRVLRVLPTAYGIGNSVDEQSRYRIQASRDALMLTVDVCSFWNWLSWDGTQTIYNGASQVATDLDLPLEVVLEYARSLLVSCLNVGFAFVEHPASGPAGDER